MNILEEVLEKREIIQAYCCDMMAATICCKEEYKNYLIKFISKDPTEGSDESSISLVRLCNIHNINYYKESCNRSYDLEYVELSIEDLISVYNNNIDYRLGGTVINLLRDKVDIIKIKEMACAAIDTIGKEYYIKEIIT